jgi:hypothetical protein
MTAVAAHRLVIAIALATGVRTASAAAATVTVSPSTTPRPPALARFAIVIGNNRPETDAVPTLRYADDDAASTHKLLLEAGVRSVLLARLDDDSRRFLPGVAPRAPPRAAAFDAAVADLFSEMRAQADAGVGSELFLFYSGHGDVDHGEGYVLLEDRRLTRGDLYALLARSPAARNHVFIDACKSYFLAFKRGPGGQRTPYAGSFVAPSEPGRLDNVGFVLSTSSDRDSHEWERFQGGILSHELRSALRGAADVDGDGRVTYAELGAFVATANRAIENPRFRPDVLVRPPGNDLAAQVLRWDQGTAAVRVRGGAVGHLYLENARGERVLDAHPAPGQVISLRVPPERPLFVRKHDGTAEQVVSGNGAVIVATLEPRTPEVMSKGALQIAFDRFFAEPFSAIDVAEFARAQRHLELRAAPAGDKGGDLDAPAAGRALRIGVGVTSASALVVGMAASAYSWQLSRATGGSQAEIAAGNRVIERANIISIVAYAVAVVAGAGWAWLRWHEPSQPVGPED